MSKEAMKLKTAAEKVVELCGERPLSLGKWFIDMGEACESLREALAEQPAQPGQCQCPECQVLPHASDCAVHNEPAYSKGVCSCKAQPEQEQEPVAWIAKDVLPLTHIIKAVVRREKDETHTEPLYTSPPAQHECSRSHPHENMDAMCELRTEIARLTNENARLKAMHQDDEINTYRMTLLCIRDGLQQGMSKSIQKLQAREINDVLGLPSFASYRTSPPAQRTWVGLTDEELVKFSSAELGPYDLCLEVEAKLKEKNT